MSTAPVAGGENLRMAVTGQGPCLRPIIFNGAGGNLNQASVGSQPPE